jgi:hypothetical protein
MNDRVNDAIIKRVLIPCYEIIDSLLTAQTTGKPVSKEVVLAAKKILPGKYTNSFQAPKK